LPGSFRRGIPQEEKLGEGIEFFSALPKGKA